MVPKKNLTITELYDLQPVVKLCFILKFSAAKVTFLLKIGIFGVIDFELFQLLVYISPCLHGGRDGWVYI